jgi:hypothetical protein
MAVIAQHWLREGFEAKGGFSHGTPREQSPRIIPVSGREFNVKAEGSSGREDEF